MRSEAVANASCHPPTYLTTPSAVAPIIAVLYLGQILGSPALQTVQLGGYLGLVKGLMPFLFTYALVYNAVPVFRAFWIKGANAKIAKRNKTRRLWRSVLQGGGENVTRKLNAARRFARNIKSIGSQREVYDSGKDIVDSMEERERKEMEEFDRKFKG